MLDDSAAVQGGMPRPPSDNVQITVRVPPQWQADADEIARLMSRPGFAASRTDAFRAALAKGLEALKAELSAPPAPASRPQPKKKR